MARGMALKYTIGLDEVGRGALAGPVTVGAVVLGAGTRLKTVAAGLPLRDSKKLTPRQREEWVRRLKMSGTVPYAFASVSAKRIDRVNISRAANIAAGAALRRVCAAHGIDLGQARVFLDGGLFLPDGAFGPVRARTVIKGDEKIPAISLASIVAKVHRDRLMVRRHSKFPEYGFAKHKGYGTRAHIRLVKRRGLSPMHRKTFCRFA